jgi:two-component system, chemotaxis family, chemotaxis protein CheY
MTQLDTFAPSEGLPMPKNILVVDDNASIRFLIRSLLESTGCLVCGEAEDGADAIEKAKQLKPDLICLDLSMPRMNGAEAASVLKRLMPGVPIILFTMHEDSIGQSLARAVGVDKVLGKPDGMSRLTESIAELLNRAPT